MMLLTGWLQSWQKTVDYDGRATRFEFWNFLLINTALLILLGYLVIAYCTAAGIQNGEAYAATLQQIFLTLALFSLFALGIRRMRDVRRSGWWFGALYALPPLWLLLVGALEPMVSGDAWPLVYALCTLLCGLPGVAIVLMCCRRSQRARQRSAFEQVLVETQDA